MTVKLDWKNLTYIPVDFCILSLYSVELSLFESNIDYDKLQETIDNLLKSKEVSQKELAILANSNIRLMTIGNKGIKDINPDNPFTSILTYLSSTVTPDDFGGPISFSASNIKDNSVFVNYFNVQ